MHSRDVGTHRLILGLLAHTDTLTPRHTHRNRLIACFSSRCPLVVTDKIAAGETANKDFNDQGDLVARI